MRRLLPVIKRNVTGRVSEQRMILGALGAKSVAPPRNIVTFSVRHAAPRSPI
jgi:hypothetical protein